jgi:hypothetical protein
MCNRQLIQAVRRKTSEKDREALKRLTTSL